MNIQQIIYAIKVYEYHSFTEAAKSLYISQPRLSQAIRELEEELGFEIFMRSRKGISGPTVKGTEFIDQARVLLRQFSALESLKERNVSSFELASTLLVQAQDAFMDLCKDSQSNNRFNINIWFCGCYEAAERIKSMSSEIGVVAILDDQFEEWIRYFRNSNIEYHELSHDNLFVTLKKDDPLASAKSIKADDLIGYVYVAENCSRMNDNTAKMNDFLDRVSPESRITVSNTDMMYSIASSNMESKSFIFDPIPPCKNTLEKYNLVSIPFDNSLMAHVGYICLTERKLSKLATRYLELLKEKMP